MPASEGKKAFLFEKGMDSLRLGAVIKEATEERAKGGQVLVAQMNKNKNSRRNSFRRKDIQNLKSSTEKL